MTLVDPFPMDQNRIIQDLARRVAALEAQAGQSPPLQITKASDAFLIPASGAPATPPSGAYLYTTGSGELRWRSTMGDRSLIMPIGSSVANPPNFQSGSASGTDATVINQLRADAAGTKIALDNLLTSLRAAPLILPS